jgi:hypothetical protein
VNHASCTGHIDDSAFKKKVHRDDGHAVIDTCGGLINVYQTHHQPGMASG